MADVPSGKPGQDGPAERNTARNDSGAELKVSPMEVDAICVLRDDRYDALRAYFSMTGRGRRPALPWISTVTNRLLAQFCLLKDSENATWELVTSWFLTVLPKQNVSKGQLQYRCQMSVQQASALRGDSLEDFLNTQLSFDVIPEPLSKLGLTRTILLQKKPHEFCVQEKVNLSSNVVIALNSFRIKESLPAHFVYKWVQKLGDLDICESQIRNKVIGICSKYEKLKKGKGDVLENFLNEEIITQIKPHVLTSKNQNEVRQHKAVVKLQGALDGTTKEIESLKMRIDILRDYLQRRNEEMTEKDQKIASLQKQNRELTASNKELRMKLDETKASKIYKKNHQLKNDLEEMRSEYKTLKLDFDSSSADIEQLTKRITQLEKDLAAANAKTVEIEDDVKTLLSKKDELQSIISKLNIQLNTEQTLKSRWKKKCKEERSVSSSLLDTIYEKEEENELRVRECTHNKFKQNIRLAYMSLQGETDIPACKCSKVVAIVSKHIFGKEFKEEDLPSTSTALNVADEGHHVTKHHIVQEIKNSSHFTLATDGTSRQKQHYIEQHIILNCGKMMSMGFFKVAVDDAKTLLEQTIEMMEELAEVYTDNGDFKEDTMKELISKMKCLMSDRAANMKLFDKKVADFKKGFLGEDEAGCSTHFLFCNAHFLLGLSRAADEAVQVTEDKIKNMTNSSLGRDTQKAFNRFCTSNENAACRLVRLAAEVLGPRGDEQSGCRAEWLAYCEMIGTISKFTSFRGNRFNNLFENASALIFHLDHIKIFLEQFASNSNLKLLSILADIKDNAIISIVGALALFNLAVTGTYWQLMNSTLTYGSFPKYVKKLLSTLERFADDETVLSDCSVSVFGDFTVEDAFTVDFLQSSVCSADVSALTFHNIAKKSCDVLRRQLNDFLEGGVFGGEIEEEVQKVLDTCPLTNLVGERLFGDLDYDMLKRRNATTHHRSTISMWKHNKTAKWLGKQKGEERTKIMTAATKNASLLRKKHKESERLGREKIKEKLKENDRQKKAKEIKFIEMKTTILDAIIAQGGPCKTKADVDALFKKGNANDLKMQIRYREIFLEKKHLRLSGSVRILYSTLLQDINEDSTSPPPQKKS